MRFGDRGNFVSTERRHLSSPSSIPNLKTLELLSAGKMSRLAEQVDPLGFAVVWIILGCMDSGIAVEGRHGVVFHMGSRPGDWARKIGS